MQTSREEMHKPRNVKKDKYSFTVLYFPSSLLPSDMPITTPFTFPWISKMKVILILDKFNEWNPIGGHIENKESWIEALKREAEEEANVTINDINIAGYFKIIHDMDVTKYPKESILPITYSHVLVDNGNLIQSEVKERKIVSIKDAIKLLSQRTDENQMLNVFKHILDISRLWRNTTFK